MVGLGAAGKQSLQHEHAAMSLAAPVISWGGFAVVPPTAPAVSRFDGLVQAKLNVKRNDLRIAAIALELGGIEFAGEKRVVRYRKGGG